MEYRSLSFHGWGINPDLIRRGAQLGFNDVTIQTEGGTTDELAEIREVGREEGYFELADELDMTITVWVHEFEDYDGAWGPVALDNDRLWAAIAERYERVLEESLPEMDYLALVVSECQIEVHEPPIVRRLVETINEQCRRTDTTLVLRTFHRHPDELERLSNAIDGLPPDVAVQNKNAPQDFHVRSVPHPLIGAVGDRTEFVEVDLANEYYRQEHTAVCLTDDFAEQFEYWEEQGVDGVAARVSRRGRGWRQKTAKSFHDVLDEAEEANLWTLGQLATEESVDLDDLWAEFATHLFGAEAAGAMTRALRPTGEVVAEGLCVGDFHFGKTKWNGILPQSSGGVPALRTMRGYSRNSYRARAYDDETAEEFLLVSPFGRKASQWRFDESAVPDYHRTRKGHPDVIAAKEAGYESALETAAECLDAVDEAEPHLPDDAYEYFRFKLEENEFHLRAMSEMQLAWLKASNRIYYEGTDRAWPDATAEMRGHLATLETLCDRYDESYDGEWRDETYSLDRGDYIDIPGFVFEFQRHFGIEDYESFSGRAAE